MKKWILIIVSIMFSVTSAAHAEDNYAGVKNALFSTLERVSNPKGCEALREGTSKSGNSDMRALMISSCDSDFDMSKPIVFSEMNNKKYNNELYVCGIASGTTLYGRKIGTRFIAVEPYHLILKLKLSKRPIVYLKNNHFLINDYHTQLKEFNELYSKACQ